MRFIHKSNEEIPKAEHLVLAGGGHSHVLLLKRWAMRPALRPSGMITLVNRNSTCLYSGMLPGLIAGNYQREEIEIDLRQLAIRARVGIVISKIIGIECIHNRLLLESRPPIYFNRLSINVGAETFRSDEYLEGIQSATVFPIKPLEPFLDWLEKEDVQLDHGDVTPLTVIGAGLAGIEVVLALRHRWPARVLKLKSFAPYPRNTFTRALNSASIEVVTEWESRLGKAILCTGSRAPEWLESSGLPVNSLGRILTDKTLRVIGFPNIFAAGDCAVIEQSPRPASGVWAVRSSLPLSRNLERANNHKPLRTWSPQRRSLKLVGGINKYRNFTAWALWGNFVFGPYPMLWGLKSEIDRRFIRQFKLFNYMEIREKTINPKMFCRGCAAKLPADNLKEALKQANLEELGRFPEDSVKIARTFHGNQLVQTVDGFPAILSDPWLNGMISTLHACSDIWATGANVISAQALVTLPAVDKKLQQDLLSQTLSGIQSALNLQSAQLIGGHTFESRTECSYPISLGIQVSLCVNGVVPKGAQGWSKGGLESGDHLLLSRAIGSGVILAAAMQGRSCTLELDSLLNQMSTSQHYLLEDIYILQERFRFSENIHACTDVTGFGLLGHLGEMIYATNEKRNKERKEPLRVLLDIDSIPSFDGALDLLEEGFSSTLAASNRSSLSLLNPMVDGFSLVGIVMKNVNPNSSRYKALLELLVDPQTCGPLLISCKTDFSKELIKNGDWHLIGKVE